MKLENWSVIQIGSEYDSPEMFSLRFQGIVFGHPRFEDGSHIVTTEIVGFREGFFKTISGSEYILGKVDPEYEKVYPNSLNRILNSAKTRWSINKTGIL